MTSRRAAPRSDAAWDTLIVVILGNGLLHDSAKRSGPDGFDIGIAPVGDTPTALDP